jgi:hypothetical protein
MHAGGSAMILVLLVARAAAADPAPVNLLAAVPTTVAVSSTVDNPAIRPEHLVDGKLETAWNSRTDELAGAWIAFRLPANVRATAIKLTVGFTKVDKQLGDLFAMNHRITSVRVSHDGKVIATKALDPAARALQAIPIDGGGGDYRIEILAVVAGTKPAWREVSVSELEVWGTLTSGAAKAQRPVVHVGSLDRDALTRAQCVKAMFPAARAGRIGAAPDADRIVDWSTLMLGGDLDVCRIDHAPDGPDPEPIAELATVKRTPRLAVVQRLAPLPAYKHQDHGMGDEKTVELDTFALTTTETALLVTTTAHGYAPMSDDGTRATRLYRVTAKATTLLLEIASRWSAGESGDRDLCTLQEEPVGATPQDLHVRCVEAHSRYPGSKEDADWEKERIETYHWNGDALVKE